MYKNAKKKGAAAALKRAAAQRRAEEERDRRYRASALTGPSTDPLEMSKREKAIEMMQRASRQRREKTTRLDVAEQEKASKIQAKKEAVAAAARMQQTQQQLEQLPSVFALAGDAPPPEPFPEPLADPGAMDTSVELRGGGLGMKLRDGRTTTPSRVSRLSRTSEELGVPNLNLAKALAKSKTAGKARCSSQPPVAPTVAAASAVQAQSQQQATSAEPGAADHV